MHPTLVEPAAHVLIPLVPVPAKRRGALLGTSFLLVRAIMS
jgi:hypothetical protein